MGVPSHMVIPCFTNSIDHLIETQRKFFKQDLVESACRQSQRPSHSPPILINGIKMHNDMYLRESAKGCTISSVTLILHLHPFLNILSRLAFYYLYPRSPQIWASSSTPTHRGLHAFLPTSKKLAARTAQSQFEPAMSTIGWYLGNFLFESPKR